MGNQENEFTKPNQEIIANCKTCWFPIYQGEVFYSVDLKQNSDYQVDYHFGTSIGDGSNQGNWSITEVWTQCGWCYWQWQEEIRRSKAPPPPPLPPPPAPFNWWGWGIPFVFLVSLAVAGYLFYARGKDIVFALGCFAAGIISGIILIGIIKTIFKSEPPEPPLPPQPILVNRFKLRRREQNE